MAIYVVPKDAEVEKKTPNHAEMTQAVKKKTYTQEEVLAMLKQVQEEGK